MVAVCAKALLWLMFLLSADVLHAEGGESIQSVESIAAAIQQFVESKFRQSPDEYEIKIPPIDPRLRLALCSGSMEVFTPQGAREMGQVSVGIRCMGAQPWTIYHRIYIRVFRPVAVLVGAYNAGTVLSSADIRAERRDISALNGQFISPEGAIGRPLKKALPANTVLIPEFLTTIKAVKRGEQVTIRNRSDVFEISMSGIALADGEIGQRIRVRNEQSGRIIQATVTGPGVVDVNP